ncbi:hypothetical protein V8F33_010672 [Rhypophila sp. PSN 637]
MSTPDGLETLVRKAQFIPLAQRASNVLIGCDRRIQLADPCVDGVERGGSGGYLEGLRSCGMKKTRRHVGSGGDGNPLSRRFSLVANSLANRACFDRKYPNLLSSPAASLLTESLNLIAAMPDQATENADKAPKLSCSGTNQSAIPQTYPIPTVELSDRHENQYDDTWPGCGDQNPGYYRHEDDRGHILELDPITGKFVPQSELRGRNKDMTDVGNESCSNGQGKVED